MTLELEIRDERLTGLFPENAKLEKLETGFTFTEGPIWHPDDHYLIFSDIAESIQYKWTEADGLSVFRKPSNQTNGNAFDLEGRVLSCEHASSCFTRHDHNGKLLSVLASHYEGKELNSPNDVVCDSKGRIWFTDPNFGRTREELGVLRDQELDFQGVYRLDPDGTLTAVAKDFKQPNGLCLSLDENQLYVNDSADPSIRCFDIAEDGSLAGGDIWVRVEGEAGPRPKWVPDGMKLSLDGHLFCNGPGGVYVYDMDATCWGVILMPEKSTNFCFGGPNRDQLFITASSGLYRVATTTTGPAMIHQSP
ncbi:MAG: SMP-30/gluconolactonase/LRE family protein [Pseudomonadota bacterium]